MKSKEWIIATKLEMIYDKNDILTMYANTVDFGNNSFGIKTAARAYYNTTPKDLTTDQIAVLVGMLKATTSYSPILNPEKSKMRRNVVLSNMMTHGDLSKDEYKSLSELPIKLNRHIAMTYHTAATTAITASMPAAKNHPRRRGCVRLSSTMTVCRDGAASSVVRSIDLCGPHDPSGAGQVL